MSKKSRTLALVALAAALVFPVSVSGTAIAAPRGQVTQFGENACC